MFARLALAALVLTAPLSSHAAREHVAAGADTHDVFIDRVSGPAQHKYVDVAVLRDYQQTVTMGRDPVTGRAYYPHRSVTLDYKADCATNMVAVATWQMFSGRLGTGEVVWSQPSKGKPAFVKAVNDEMRAVLRSACRIETVAR